MEDSPMRVLLIYPKFPPSFFSFEGVLELVNRTALSPPLGLITVAALLPADWEFQMVDCNIRRITEKEWDWAEMVMISGMTVQRTDFVSKIQEARLRGKPVVVGGPLATSIPKVAAEAGAEFLVLDEG